MKLLALPALAILTAFAVACSPTAKNTADLSSSTGIIGGTEVSEGDTLQQSIVGIYDMNKGSLCTGSLIKDNVVMTAAHCIGENASDLLIVFATDLAGTFQRGQTDKAYLTQKVRRSVKTIVHDDWKKEHKEDQAWGDIALIKFAGKTPAGFKPATFIASSDLLKKGTTVIVAGYGVSHNELIPVSQDSADFKKKLDDGQVFCDDEDLGKAKCYSEIVTGEGLLRSTEITVEEPFNATEVVLNQTEGKAACEGDSGGPAYLKVDGQYQLWGVTSRGTRGCNGFVLYTDAIALEVWRNEKVAEILK